MVGGNRDQKTAFARQSGGTVLLSTSNVYEERRDGCVCLSEGITEPDRGQEVVGETTASLAAAADSKP